MSSHHPFLLFVGRTYYADGGADDFQSAHPTADAAKAAVKQAKNARVEGGYGWAHVARLDGARLVILHRADIPDSYRTGGALRLTDGGEYP